MARLPTVLAYLDGYPHGANDRGPSLISCGYLRRYQSQVFISNPNANLHHGEFYRPRGSSLPRRLFFRDLRRPSSPPSSPRHHLLENDIVHHSPGGGTPSRPSAKSTSCPIETDVLTHATAEAHAKKLTLDTYGTRVSSAGTKCPYSRRS